MRAMDLRHGHDAAAGDRPHGGLLLAFSARFAERDHRQGNQPAAAAA